MKFRTMLFFIISFFLVANNIFSVSAEELYPYQEIGDGLSALSVTLTLVDGVVLDPEGNVYMSFAYNEAAANLITTDMLDPFGKIPEFKFCAVKLSAGGDPAPRLV